MTLAGVKALTFDTGGTILDWHTGFRTAFEAAGARHGVDRDWGKLTNQLRRRSMAAMLNLGEQGPPAYNFDGAHRSALDALLSDEGLDVFDESDRHAIAWEAPHSFDCWPDFPKALPKLRNRFIVASFSLLSYRLIIDTAKHNGLSWDAVLSCEGMGVYKLLSRSYELAAVYLQLGPEQCCMVACHPYDLDAAKAVGFKTAHIRRPDEWGPGFGSSSDNGEERRYDIEVDDFPGLLRALRR
ncbi:MAG: hypothetical protein R8L07_07280 [Alphaproteobacteria bacterium]|nr:hypothetical protein [Alphaproteobacteria bacterium]